MYSFKDKMHNTKRLIIKWSFSTPVPLSRSNLFLHFYLFRQAFMYLIYSKKYAIDDTHFDSSISDVSIDFLVNYVK